MRERLSLWGGEIELEWLPASERRSSCGYPLRPNAVRRDRHVGAAFANSAGWGFRYPVLVLDEGGGGADGDRQCQTPEADPIIKRSGAGASAGEPDDAAQGPAQAGAHGRGPRGENHVGRNERIQHRLARSDDPSVDRLGLDRRGGRPPVLGQSPSNFGNDARAVYETYNLPVAYTEFGDTPGNPLSPTDIVTADDQSYGVADISGDDDLDSIENNVAYETALATQP